MKSLDKENYLDVRYDDNHILVVVKRANLLTQPNETDQISLEEIAKSWIKNKYKKKGDVFLHAIHRLDKEVEGLVLFAKTSKALSRLNLEMKQKNIIRRYIAEVEGKLEEKSGVLKDYLVHGSHIAIITTISNKEAKLAQLSFKVIKELKDTSLIEIELETGRYHQIRAQLSNLGHPIVGDKKYLSKRDLNQIHLCCYCLEFIHPVKKEKIVLKIKPGFDK
ncbi:MAG: RNA pseudouridine synthase [Parachlamydiales bacterium]|jgi:23S rRNA pseudouridine1911/1915/1917 synthase